MQYAIEIKGLKKQYKIFRTRKDRIKNLLGFSSEFREFTAVDSLDLSIPRGSTIGIVGDNGAGKSTLLQLIAGAIEPTEGTVRTEGIVLALLELGLGFHPDFTGRDNILFYSDVLGLSRRFVLDRLEAVIEFSELADFVDQPLKTYSTGMRARLAFSLVSNLDPDILIVDEALAVGDLHFQQKCIQRMNALKERGATILFCSHSIYQINMFCSRVLWMRRGRLAMDGVPEDVLPAYEAYQLRKGKSDEGLVCQNKRSSAVRIASFALRNAQPIAFGEDIIFTATFVCQSEASFHVGFSIRTEDGRGIYGSGTHLKGYSPLTQETDTLQIILRNSQLLGGFYMAHLRVLDVSGLVILDDDLIESFQVRKTGPDLGLVHLQTEWSTA